MRTELLRQVLPACLGNAIDAKALECLVREEPAVSRWLTAYVRLACARTTETRASIASPMRAVGAAGAQTTALMALLATLSPLLNADAGVSPAVRPWVWRTLLLSGCLARNMAELEPGTNPDLAFSVAILRGLEGPLSVADSLKATLAWWEAGTPVTHPPKVTLTALEAAQAPDGLLPLVHETPFSAAPERKGLIEVVDLAQRLAHALGPHGSDADARVLFTSISAPWGMTVEQGFAMIREAIDTSMHLAEALGVPYATPIGMSDLERPTAQLAVRGALQAAVIAEQERDIGELHGRLRDQARKDVTTDLPHLRRFVRLLRIAMADEEASPDGLICVDLPGFSQVFTRVGIEESDRLLNEAARVITSILPDSVVGRVGSATFVATFQGTERDAHVLAARARDGVRGLRDSTGRPVRAISSYTAVEKLAPDTSAELLIEVARRASLPDADPLPPTIRRRGLNTSNA